MSTYGGAPPRLINVRTLRLDSIVAPGPKYAILSHTWGGAEVTFQEWQQGGFEHKEGYAKILGACREAKRKQLAYLRVDTCCIDKQSSAELSRAINSMYAWYRRAAVCFAYLSDLQVHATAGSLQGNRYYAAGSPEKATLDSLGKSRWFTRGWTLQELLAPSDVLFFGCDWTMLGNSEDLAEPISRITGIDADALMHRKPLADFSIAQRLSWASSRETKEIEDQAYCLLGICEVHLSPTYGEGKNAFRRLQEQLFMVAGDDSVLAWNTLDDSRATHLYADSPADYASCDDVVQDGSRAGQSNFWVTNIGLSGSMFTLDNYCSRSWTVATRKVAILGCRHKDDETHLLAIGLEPEVLGETLLKGRYTIRPFQKSSNVGMLPSYAGTRVFPISKTQLAEAEEKQITVSKQLRPVSEQTQYLGSPDSAKVVDPYIGSSVPGRHPEESPRPVYVPRAPPLSQAQESEWPVTKKVLLVTLEEIYYGTTKKLEITRKNYDKHGGVSIDQRIVEVPIRRGIWAGTKFKFANFGDHLVDMPDNVRQDIHVIVEERTHPTYTKKRDHLKQRLNITAEEARTSWERVVKTIDGKTLTVHSKGLTNPNFEERFPELGLPNRIDPSKRGDFIVNVSILPPERA